MNGAITSYLKGREEGYFNVRLYNILSLNSEERAFFGKGYQMGKAIRKKQETISNNSSDDLYYNYRKIYITIMGYETAYENYEVDNSLIKQEDDKKVFEEGYRFGESFKEKDLKNLMKNDLKLFTILAGYHNAISNNFDYSFIVKDEDRQLFHQGYVVGSLCSDIKREAIEELSETQFQVYSKQKSKNKK